MTAESAKASPACEDYHHPVREHVEGSPYQPGERVLVADLVDQDVADLSECLGRRGTVEYLEYSCGCGQSFPDDPMIGVRLDGGDEAIDFWKEELRRT